MEAIWNYYAKINGLRLARDAPSQGGVPKRTRSSSGYDKLPELRKSLRPGPGVEMRVSAIWAGDAWPPISPDGHVRRIKRERIERPAARGRCGPAIAVDQGRLIDSAPRSYR